MTWQKFSLFSLVHVDIGHGQQKQLSLSVLLYHSGTKELKPNPGDEAVIFQSFKTGNNLFWQ